jgi:hypothetical protein
MLCLLDTRRYFTLLLMCTVHSAQCTVHTVSKAVNRGRFITVGWSADVVHYYLLLILLCCGYEQLDTLLFVLLLLYALLYPTPTSWKQSNIPYIYGTAVRCYRLSCQRTLPPQILPLTALKILSPLPQ